MQLCTYVHPGHRLARTIMGYGQLPHSFGLINIITQTKAGSWGQKFDSAEGFLNLHAWVNGLLHGPQTLAPKPATMFEFCVAQYIISMSTLLYTCAHVCTILYVCVHLSHVHPYGWLDQPQKGDLASTSSTHNHSAYFDLVGENDSSFILLCYQFVAASSGKLLTKES